MTDLFYALVVNSLRGAVLILAVLVLRMLLRKTPRRVFCLLWSLAALRLLVPLRLTAFFGLLPGQRAAAFVLTERIEAVAAPAAAFAVPAAGAPAFDLLSVLPWLWLTGTAGLLLWAMVRALRLRRRLAGAVEAENGVRTSDRISTPFTFGLLRPRIYLPKSLPEEDLPWVLAHERAHIRSGDICRKALGYLLLAVYWFNPLCWLGWFAFCRDLELACDERVTKNLTLTERKAYALALLRCSAPAGAFGAVAFGEKPVRSRIRAVLNGRSQPRWRSVGTGAVCALLILCLCFEAPASAQSPAPLEPAAAARPTEPAASGDPIREPTEPGEAEASVLDWYRSALLAGLPTDPAQEEAVLEAMLADNATRWESAGPLSSDEDHGSYRVAVITNDPGSRLSVKTMLSPDGQNITLLLRGVGGKDGEMRIERSTVELEAPFACSSWYADDEGKLVYWEIQTTP